MVGVSLPQDLGVGEGKVLLSSVYPRRDLTNDVDCQTMQDLQLVPSGVVIVRMKGVSMSGEGVMEGAVAQV